MDIWYANQIEILEEQLHSGDISAEQYEWEMDRIEEIMRESLQD